MNGYGRGEETFRGWLQALSAEQKAAIQLFAMDMHRATWNAVDNTPGLGARGNCPRPLPRPEARRAKRSTNSDARSSSARVRSFGPSAGASARCSFAHGSASPDSQKAELQASPESQPDSRAWL